MCNLFYILLESKTEKEKRKLRGCQGADAICHSDFPIMNASETELTKACIIYMNVFESFLILYKVSPVTIHVASFHREGGDDVLSFEPSSNYPY